jgi:hypothetical protein
MSSLGNVVPINSPSISLHCESWEACRCLTLDDLQGYFAKTQQTRMLLEESLDPLYVELGIA